MSLQHFINAYVECAFFASTDDEGNPLDQTKYACDMPADDLKLLHDDAASFYNDPANRDDLDLWYREFGGDSQAGHDFWLTRNGHGAGFWDHFSGDSDAARAGSRLSTAAKAYGSCDLYLGDDGKVYAS